MTIKEAIRTVAMDYDNGVKISMRQFYKILKKVEKNQDEFVVGFAEWCVLWGVALKDNKNYCYGGMNNDYTIQELLEIYKKEKGL